MSQPLRILLIPPTGGTTAALAALHVQLQAAAQSRRDAQITVFPDPSLPGTTKGLRRGAGPGAYRKIAIRFAIDGGFDFVLTVDSAAQETGAAIGLMLDTFEKEPLLGGVLSDFRSPLAAGRRLWRWSLNRLHRRIAGIPVDGWSSAWRMFRTQALAKTAYELNTADSHFDTEVLLQLHDQGFALRLLSLPGASSGAKHFPGPARALNSLKAAFRYRLQQVNLFYDLRFHPEVVFAGEQPERPSYQHKFTSWSPHSFVCTDPALIPRGARVLDIGCSSGYVARRLAAERGCRVTGVDRMAPGTLDTTGFDYRQIDLEKNPEALEKLLEEGFDVVLLLDVLEHLSMPELFLLRLYRRRYARTPVFVLSTGNVAFVIIRLMLLLGYFNYGQKGILDITHKRLFSVRTFQNLLDQTGFRTLRRMGFPLPFQQLGWPEPICRFLERLNRALIRLRLTLFSYQIMVVAQPVTPPEQTPSA